METINQCSNAERVHCSGQSWHPEAPPSAMPPNPSVKGTSTSGLRPLATAPYLER
jgi:hypothetical protein